MLVLLPNNLKSSVSVTFPHEIIVDDDQGHHHEDQFSKQMKIMNLKIIDPYLFSPVSQNY
jgi:hypothetical protein